MRFKARSDARLRASAQTDYATIAPERKEDGDKDFAANSRNAQQTIRHT